MPGCRGQPGPDLMDRQAGDVGAQAGFEQLHGCRRRGAADLQGDVRARVINAIAIFLDPGKTGGRVQVGNVDPDNRLGRNVVAVIDAIVVLGPQIQNRGSRWVDGRIGIGPADCKVGRCRDDVIDLLVETECVRPEVQVGINRAVDDRTIGRRIELTVEIIIQPGQGAGSGTRNIDLHGLQRGDGIALGTVVGSSVERYAGGGQGSRGRFQAARIGYDALVATRDIPVRGDALQGRALDLEQGSLGNARGRKIIGKIGICLLHEQDPGCQNPRVAPRCRLRNGSRQGENGKRAIGDPGRPLRHLA